MKTNPTQFKPGNSGRPKGSKNKLTREIKERVEWVLELLDDQLEEDIQKLKAGDRVRLWVDLQEFVRPKLQRMNLDLTPVDDAVQKITFEVIRSTKQESEQKTEERFKDS
jgi:hypothetical protein